MDKAVVDSIMTVLEIVPAAGYLDPGLGAMIISAVVGIFATLSLAIKGFWYKVTKPFRRSKDSGSEK